MDELIAFVVSRRLEEGDSPLTVLDRTGADADEHIARHDRARVLEIAALDCALRWQAAVWCDHPEYRAEEWGL